MTALGGGQVDAVTTDDIILAGYAAQAEYAGKFKVVGEPFSEEPYGIGLKKTDTAGCTKINEILKPRWTTAPTRPRGTRRSARVARPRDLRRSKMSNCPA